MAFKDTLTFMRNSSVLAMASAIALTLTACAGGQVSAQTDAGIMDPMRPFPAATADQTRHVLNLPPVANENDLKVQLILGQMQNVDCNHQLLGGQVQRRTAEGWGYDYFVLPEVGPGISTLMACPPGSTQDRFITLGQETIVDYNSRLPIVVYTPKDVEVRYRLWRAGEVLALN